MKSKCIEVWSECFSNIATETEHRGWSTHASLTVSFKHICFISRGFEVVICLGNGFAV